MHLAVHVHLRSVDRIARRAEHELHDGDPEVKVVVVERVPLGRSVPRFEVPRQLQQLAIMRLDVGGGHVQAAGVLSYPDDGQHAIGQVTHGAPADVALRTATAWPW